MSVENLVIALIDEGNPIPYPSDLDRDRLDAAAYLATLETRSSTVTQTNTKNQQQKEKKKTVRSWWLATAAVIVLAGVAFILISQDDNPSVANGPAATVEGYIAAYNEGDIDEVMAFFTEDSVVIGHPFAPESSGLAEIRAVQIRDLLAAAAEDPYTISNVEVSGNTVTWDHVWVSDAGESYCQYGHKAVVEDGKFVSWRWGVADGFSCHAG